MNDKYYKVFDEKGNVIHGLMKNKYGMIISTDTTMLKKHKIESKKVLEDKKVKQEFDNRIKNLENQFLEVRKDVSDIKDLILSLIQKTN